MSVEAADANAGPFSARTAAILLAVAIMSFAAVVTLTAWSPELARKDYAGAHPYSRSASGYAGLVGLLEADGREVSVSRFDRSLTESEGGLLIVTLPAFGDSDDYAPLELPEPALVVLPKWDSVRADRNAAWEESAELLAPYLVDRALRVLDEDASAWRIRTPAALEAPFGSVRPKLGEDMQVIRSELLLPVVETAAGALIARHPERELYVVADPDLLNTAGLAEIENAALALGLIDWIAPQYPITLDATLHGFTQSEGLLRMLLDIPFIGATLIALSAAGLLGWASAVRFGSPEREGRAIALGKEALADNTAGLVAMARREARMAPAYAALNERAAAKAIGAPRSLSREDLAALVDRLGEDPPAEGDTRAWSRLAAALETDAMNRDELVRKARALYRRRKEITHGRV